MYIKQVFQECLIERYVEFQLLSVMMIPFIGEAACIPIEISSRVSGSLSI